MDNIGEIIIQVFVIIIPTVLAFIGTIKYVRVKKTIISKFLLAGAFLLLMTWLNIFFVDSFLRKTDPMFYSKTFEYISIGTACLGYIVFFVSIFFLLKSLAKKERFKQKENDINNIENLGR